MTYLMTYCCFPQIRRKLFELLLIAALMLWIAQPQTLSAAILSYQTTTPTLGIYDVGNVSGATADSNAVSSGADSATYVAGDRPQQGQTFTTGTSLGSYQINAVWVRHVSYTNNPQGSLTYWRTQNGAPLTVRVTKPSAAGTSSFVLHSETVTTTGGEAGTSNALAPIAAATNSRTGTGVWVRFAFSTPVVVQPNALYGFDVTSNSTTFYFETLTNGTDVYSGGNAYNGSTNGSADNIMNALSGDRVFVVELGPVVSVAPYDAPQVQAEPFSLDRVQLLDSRFKTNQELHRTGYLAWIDPDRLLYPFRVNAGLSTGTSTSLGGWEGGQNSSGFTAVRGHIGGHYLSAASKMYAATGDASFKTKVQYLVTELKKVQDALAPAEQTAGRPYGYLSAFPSSFFTALENTPTSAQVPFYTIHKIMAGLADAYRYCGINQALDMAIAMSDYHQYRMSLLSPAQIEAMFIAHTGATEWGGMNETLTDIYLLSKARGDTNPERHLTFAEVFHRDWFVTPLYNNQDILATGESGGSLHANTHIPQVVGFARSASVLNTSDVQRNRLYTAADNFWHMVINHHWLVLGGNSYQEHFRAAGVETVTSLTDLKTTAETCNAYNMLKLSKELFEHTPSVEYADYYEHALYNDILASLAPDTGLMTYFIPMASGHFKTYALPEGSSWCCLGTGIENTGGYGQAIYFHKDDALWVNLFIPSILNWSERGMTVRMDTAFPQSSMVQLTMGCATPTSAKIRFRIPSWVASTPTVTINGATQNVTPTAGSYLELSRTWSNGDVVTVTLPMNLRIDRSMDDSTQASLFYGPILLSASLGSSGMPASDQAAGQLDYAGLALTNTPALIGPSATDLSTWVQSTSQPLNFTANIVYPGDPARTSLTFQPFYDIHHVHYATYWKLLAPTGICTWTGTGAQVTWSTVVNWDTLPSATYGLHFAASGGGAPSNNFTADTQFNGIEFTSSAGAFVLGGNRIGLEGDVRNSSSVSQQINMPIYLKDGFPWQFDAANGDLLLGGTITGIGVLNKVGTHTLTLLGDTSLNGSVNVAVGTLQVGNGGTAGSLTTTPVSLASGADLVFNRSDTFSVGSIISGTGGRIIKRGSGTMQLLSPVMQTGSVIVEGGTLRSGTQQLSSLTHRWSFNGSLNDSVGTSNATLVDVGANNATLSSTDVAVTGGTQSAADYISLGSGLLPKDGTAVTIELWATQAALQSYGRIFDIGASTSEYLFMTWSQATLNTDRVEWKDNVTSTADTTAAPYTPGVEYHIAMVIEPGAGANGTTRVTWYAAPSSAVSFGSAKGTFDTSNTLAAFTDTNFWLGRSEYADSTASAHYNEVRIWNRALSSGELAELHTAGPNSLTIKGSLAATDLALGNNATFDAGANTQKIVSLSGSASSVVRLSGGQLSIQSGGSSAATFAGTLSGTGTVLNNGTLRLTGSADIPGGISLVNNGVLDLMTWKGTLPVGFVNNGTVLDRSAVKVQALDIQLPNTKITIQGYSGHTYQLQFSDNLTSNTWTNVGASVVGADAAITFTQAGGATAKHRFYRVVVDP